MKYLVGIDGGGTATKVYVSDINGNVLKRFTAGPLNINGQSLDRFHMTMNEVIDGINHLKISADDCLGIGIGAAGISNPKTQTVLMESFRAGGYGAPLYTYGDGETALAAVFPECHGIILIAGTGSICQGRRVDGSQIRAGGYGHIIDDGGSAYAIAVAILTAVVRGEDGRGEKTVLRELVCNKLAISSPAEVVGYLYDPSRNKKDIASLAVLLEPAIAAGDQVAAAIEADCVDELSLMIRTVMSQIPEEKNIALAGSVLLKNERIQQRVCEKIMAYRDDARILLAKQDASEGAMRLLKKDLHIG